MSTALVVGNMIGSGIFLLPSTLAAYGGISLVGWFFSALGAFLLATVFSRLSKLIPRVGGPYAYTKAGLGEFAAFLVAWGYWVSIWCGNAAITVAFVSYMSVFFPILATHNVAAVMLGLATIWGLSWVNSQGVKEAGKLQLITTVLKLSPIVLVAICGVFFIQWEYFFPFNLSGESSFAAIATTMTLTLWAFAGLESATIPAESVENPSKTIPRATIIGTSIATIVYIGSSMAIMGMIDPEILQHSRAPFADAAALMWGEQARLWVAAGAAIATFGALNGWILMQAQVPLAIAKDNLFPSIFGKVNRKGAPVAGIIISSLLVSILMSMNFNKNLVEQFQFMILLATLTVLVPYLFSAAAYVAILLEKKYAKGRKPWSSIVIAGLAFGYSLWAVAGSGEETVYWGFILLMAGIPFFVWMKGR